METANTDEKANLLKHLEAIRPTLIKNGMIFSEEFHDDPDYWTDVLRETGPVTPIDDNSTPPSTPPANPQTSTIKFVDAPVTSVSNNDWYLVHRLYFSCGGDLICAQGLWEYADDGDWAYGNYVRLEHEASNLHFYSVTRDFDSYWTHQRGSDVLDTGTKFTTQYFTALEREMQSGLLKTQSAQTGDNVHSTMRLTP